MKAQYNSMKHNEVLRGRPIELQSDSGQIIWGQLSIDEALKLMRSLKNEISEAKKDLDSQIEDELGEEI